MTTVYIVTNGCYSDYKIEAVFSSREAATAFVAAFAQGRHSTNERRIEEWPLDVMPEPIRQGLAPWRVDIVLSTGKVLGAERLGMTPSSGVMDWDRGSDHKVVECWARDEEHAVRIATERLQERRAKGALLG